jgi:hypothetical protein
MYDKMFYHFSYEDIFPIQSVFTQMFLLKSIVGILSNSDVQCK